MAMGMNCPACGTPAEADASFCVGCGARLEVACPDCGAPNAAGSQYCSICGRGLVAATAAVPPRAADITCPRCQAANTQGVTFCYSCGLPFESDRSPAPAPQPAPAPGRSPVPDSATPHPPMAPATAAPAGFWIRLVAALIDIVVVIAIRLILLAVLPGTSIAEYPEDPDWSRYDNIMLVADALYFTLTVSLFSTTVGKWLLGMRVLKTDGSRVNPLRAFARYVAYIPSTLLLLIGFLMIGFSSDKRGLHDRLCDTMVVRRRR